MGLATTRDPVILNGYTLSSLLKWTSLSLGPIEGNQLLAIKVLRLFVKFSLDLILHLDSVEIFLTVVNLTWLTLHGLPPFIC